MSVSGVPHAESDSSTLNADDIRAMVLGAHERILDNVDLLCALDRAVGDGDHGTTMRRAMDAARDAAAESISEVVADVFKVAGLAVLTVDGGATGPLLGSFFLGLADGADKLKTIDAVAARDCYQAAVEKLRTRTKAAAGDKTLMCALIPAATGAMEAANRGGDVLAVLRAAAEAADAGAADTQNYPAKFGRAKHQGDRTIGHRDPGAVSMALILSAFSDVAAERLLTPRNSTRE